MQSCGSMGVYTLNQVHNPEGYVYFQGSPMYNYFRRDHLGNIREVWQANMNLTVQRTNYYPSGLPWNSATGTGAGLQNKKYNGKEFVEMHGLDEYDSEARWYYPAIMRTTTIDPLAEKYYSISPYAWCGNNPIRYIDPTGMEFTDDAWKRVNKLIAEVNSRQASNNDKIADKQAELDRGGLSKRKEKSLNKQIGNLQSQNSTLEGVRGEVATLAASDQMYDIKNDNSMNINGAIPGTGENRSGAAFNFSNGNFELRLGDGSLGMLSHELKHAHQFEIGAFSSGYRRDGVPFYDKTDELEAYSRGALFGGERINTLPSLYDDLQSGPMDATKLAPIILSNPAELQKIADRTRSAFRVNGVTYIMQGGK